MFSFINSDTRSTQNNAKTASLHIVGRDNYIAWPDSDEVEVLNPMEPYA